MASINNPGSVAPIGAAGAAGQPQQMAAAQAMAREVETQRTGPAGEDGPKSAFDQMPHRYVATNPAADEAWRDLVSMQPHFGQDQIMGARPYDPAVVEYLGSKRNQAVQRKFDDLVLSAFDPLDPAQRQALEGMMPSIVQSKTQVFEMCEEQKRFLFQCSIRAAGQVSRQDWMRLVRILGGGEPLLKHPIDQAVVETPAADGIFGFLSRNSDGAALEGIFSFLSSTPANRTRGYPTDDQGSKQRRINIAKMVLQHFPRYLTGAYSTYDDGADPKKRVEAAAEAIVGQCEQFVDQYTPLGDFVNTLPAGRGATQSIGRGTVDGLFLRDPRGNTRA